MELFREIYPVAFLTKYLEHNLRPDGRLLDEPRPLSVSSDVLRSAMASSFVKLGRTTIMVAIKGELVRRKQTAFFFFFLLFFFVGASQ
jgi:exosome complex component RRP43